jgi:hypothetical protein
MYIDFRSFYMTHRLGKSATGAIAHFSAFLAALFLVAECSPRPRLALPASRKSAHSHLSN